eukprot:GHVO01065322.1.p2 GENE.GHVO01065322.1~~GHVO01065322.1.p2  ORF type:complete len:141 (+),score=24.22 GHVO01065322.1:696-1118(+)
MAAAKRGNFNVYAQPPIPKEKVPPKMPPFTRPQTSSPTVQRASNSGQTSAQASSLGLEPSSSLGISSMLGAPAPIASDTWFSAFLDSVLQNLANNPGGAAYAQSPESVRYSNTDIKRALDQLGVDSDVGYARTLLARTLR